MIKKLLSAKTSLKILCAMTGGITYMCDYKNTIKAGRHFHTPTPSLSTLWTSEYVHD